MNNWDIPELPKEPSDEWWADHYVDDEELEEDELAELEALKEWNELEEELDGEAK